MAATVKPKLISIDEAVDRVLSATPRLGVEAVPLAEALGRVCAEEVRSADRVPGFDNSAMDGYAVRAGDVAHASPDSPATLRFAGESRAGAPASVELGTGEAISISTGAMVPAGADAVVRVEDTERQGETVAVLAAVAAGNDIRRAGEDSEPGDIVVEPGTLLGPAEVGVLASVGVAAAPCARRPAMHVLTSGDELTEPGDPLPPGGIRNSNAYSVTASARACGCAVEGAGVVPDDRAATIEAVASGLAADVLVVCGGVSVGEHDHVKDAFRELGISESFWGVALRPGRPTWFGTHDGPGGERTLVFGLPGNPVSAVVTFHLFVRPAVLGMQGRAPESARIAAVLDEPYAKRPGRAHAVRCRVELRDDGWHTRPTKEQGSHVLTSMLGADGLAIVPADAGDLETGARVVVEPLWGTELRPS